MFTRGVVCGRAPSSRTTSTAACASAHRATSRTCSCRTTVNSTRPTARCAGASKTWTSAAPATVSETRRTCRWPAPTRPGETISQCEEPFSTYFSLSISLTKYTGGKLLIQQARSHKVTRRIMKTLTIYFHDNDIIARSRYNQVTFTN